MTPRTLLAALTTHHRVLTRPEAVAARILTRTQDPTPNRVTVYRQRKATR